MSASSMAILAVFPLSACGQELQTAATNTSSKLFSADDGWLDVSGFLDETYGFVPLVIPITEPAVGYGAAGGLAFIDKPLGKAQAGFGRPTARGRGPCVRP